METDNMNMSEEANKKYTGADIMRYGIVFFWMIFWFLNVTDKFIGGADLFWVGKDRFAQFVKFFSSIGVQNPSVPLGALVITTVLEIGAFVLMAAALLSLIRDRKNRAHIFFFWGTFTGLILFSFFTMGDQVFGDRFELLEHSIFWIAIIVSWGAYAYLPKTGEGISVEKTKGIILKEWWVIGAVIILSIASAFAMYDFGVEAMTHRNKIVQPSNMGNGVYKFEFPLISGRQNWERSLLNFLNVHSELRVLDIYTAPKDIKSQADGLIVYIITELK